MHTFGPSSRPCVCLSLALLLLIRSKPNQERLIDWLIGSIHSHTDNRAPTMLPLPTGVALLGSLLLLLLLLLNAGPSQGQSIPTSAQALMRQVHKNRSI
jgi:hypothetical protein